MAPGAQPEGKEIRQPGKHFPPLQGKGGAKRSYVQRKARRGRERAGRAARLFPRPRSAAVCGSPASRETLSAVTGFFL